MHFDQVIDHITEVSAKFEFNGGFDVKKETTHFRYVFGKGFEYDSGDEIQAVHSKGQLLTA